MSGLRGVFIIIVKVDCIHWTVAKILPKCNSAKSWHCFDEISRSCYVESEKKTIKRVAGVSGVILREQQSS